MLREGKSASFCRSYSNFISGVKLQRENGYGRDRETVREAREREEREWRGDREEKVRRNRSTLT